MKDVGKSSSVFFRAQLSYMVIIIYDNFRFEKTFFEKLFCFKFILSKPVMIKPSTNS